MTLLRPMLAADCRGDLSKLRFPLLASNKIDGVRCLIVDGKPVSRALKPIRNHFVRDYLSQHWHLPDLDGELVVGQATHPNAMQNTTSGVMSADGEPDFTYHVFDLYSSTDPFHSRYAGLLQLGLPLRVRVHPHRVIFSMAELEDMEEQALTAGYEGLIVRDPRGAYKENRSTLREGGMVKIKRHVDAEAIVLGAEELMHNANEATTNALGYTERTSHLANQVGMGTLGSLHVRLLSDPACTFHIGSGFTAAQRAQMWAARDNLPGRLARFKSFSASGVKDKPRHPVFLGFRDLEDL